jgi:hypothetical protein
MTLGPGSQFFTLLPTHRNLLPEREIDEVDGSLWACGWEYCRHCRSRDDCRQRRCRYLICAHDRLARSHRRPSRTPVSNPPASLSGRWTFTSGLPTVWSPAPSPVITTVPTGQFALAGLSPARTSTSFCTIRLLPRMCGGKACLRVRMQNTGEWNPAFQQRGQPLPVHLGTLTATIENRSP